MQDLFVTILTLSILGFFLILILLAIKPVTSKKFPVKWQYISWLMVLVFMLVPIYKLIPQKQYERINATPEPQNAGVSEFETPEFKYQPTVSYDTKFYEKEVEFEEDDGDDLFKSFLKYIPYVWLTGVIVYVITALINYLIYLSKKRMVSVDSGKNELLETVMQELSIKRNVKLKTACDISSPVLVGVFLPTIYLPQLNADNEKLRMVFLHELTHLKRCDLAVKWLSLIVNAIHWFNPLVYIMSRNISDCCEAGCDASVTKNMSESDKKLYMKTILDYAG